MPGSQEPIHIEEDNFFASIGTESEEEKFSDADAKRIAELIVIRSQERKREELQKQEFVNRGTLDKEETKFRKFLEEHKKLERALISELDNWDSRLFSIRYDNGSSRSTTLAAERVRFDELGIQEKSREIFNYARTVKSRGVERVEKSWRNLIESQFHGQHEYTINGFQIKALAYIPEVTVSEDGKPSDDIGLLGSPTKPRGTKGR